MSVAASSRHLLVVLQMFLTLGVVLAHDPASAPTDIDPHTKKPLKIVPLVSLKPGETKNLLLSTHCTVGSTRGGGFEFTEMRDGARKDGQTKGYEGASYSRDGVVIKVPGWEAAEKFASSPPYASLRESGIAVFEITVSASSEAKQGLLELHLLDATCSGDCNTDFRVLVTSP